MDFSHEISGGNEHLMWDPSINPDLAAGQGDSSIVDWSAGVPDGHGEADLLFGESSVYDGPHTQDVPAHPVTPVGAEGDGWDPVTGEYVHHDPGSDIYRPKS
jgi:hypothetical protein